MIIGGSFTGRRSRIQALKRVGRFKDKCFRIQDRAFLEIDATENAIRKGKLEVMISKLDKALAKEKKPETEPVVVRAVSDRAERVEQNRKYLQESRTRCYSKLKKKMRRKRKIEPI